MVITQPTPNTESSVYVNQKTAKNTCQIQRFGNDEVI